MTYKIKVLNKHLALIYYGSDCPFVEDNPFETAKQELLLEASGRKLPLPRMRYRVDCYEDDHPDFVQWYCALSNPNPPSDIDFKQDPELYRSIVEPLDLSKPYDENVIKKLYDAFRGSAKKKESIGSDEIAAQELEE